MICMAVMSWCHVYGASENGPERAEDRVAILSNVTYDYMMIYQEGQRPDCMGTVSFDVTFPPDASRILVVRTRSHLLVYDDPFYNAKFTVDVDKSATIKRINVPDTQWGSFIRVRVIYEDSNNPVSAHINSSDYLSEEDRSTIFGYLDSPQVNEDDQSINILSDGAISINSLIGGELWIYDLNGQCVKTDHFQASSVISLPESPSSLFILKVRFNNNHTITRKINR